MALQYEVHEVRALLQIIEMAGRHGTSFLRIRDEATRRLTEIDAQPIDDPVYPQPEGEPTCPETSSAASAPEATSPSEAAPSAAESSPETPAT